MQLLSSKVQCIHCKILKCNTVMHYKRATLSPSSHLELWTVRLCIKDTKDS